jgi:ATP synthase F0 subcomplex B subunit
LNVKNKVLRGCGSAAVAFGAASAMLPAQAFADEGSGVAAILPQMDEFIPMLVAFIILWIILAKFGWPLFEIAWHCVQNRPPVNSVAYEALRRDSGHQPTRT